MKNCSDVFSIFQGFSTEIQNQFGTTIKVLCTDNACEYMSSQFQSFLSSQDILHQTSCSHRPQQNGVAKRKNGHLVETARTLLLHQNVPLRFWGDAILTTCYLINNMPSSSLIIRFLTLSYIPHKIFTPFLFVSLVVHVLSMTLLQVKINFLPNLSNVFSLVTHLQKGYRFFLSSTSILYSFC